MYLVVSAVGNSGLYQRTVQYGPLQYSPLPEIPVGEFSTTRLSVEFRNRMEHIIIEMYPEPYKYAPAPITPTEEFMNALKLLHKEIATTNSGPWQAWLQAVPIAMQQLLMLSETKRLNPDVPIHLCMIWSGIVPSADDDLSDLEEQVGRGFIPPGDMAYRALTEAYEKRCVCPPARAADDPDWIDSVTVDDACQAQQNLEQLIATVVKVEKEVESKTTCPES